jgi:hypothetical protein
VAGEVCSGWRGVPSVTKLSRSSHFTPARANFGSEHRTPHTTRTHPTSLDLLFSTTVARHFVMEFIAIID